MRTLVALVALLLTAGPAVADKVDPDTEIAQRHFARGRAAYDASRYAEGVLEFDVSGMDPKDLDRAARDYRLAPGGLCAGYGPRY